MSSRQTASLIIAIAVSLQIVCFVNSTVTAFILPLIGLAFDLSDNENSSLVEGKTAVFKNSVFIKAVIAFFLTTVVLVSHLYQFFILACNIQFFYLSSCSCFVLPSPQRSLNRNLKITTLTAHFAGSLCL